MYDLKNFQKEIIENKIEKNKQRVYKKNSKGVLIKEECLNEKK